MTVTYIYLNQDDNNIPLDFQITDQTNAIVDLSNTSNDTFQMWLPGATNTVTNSSMTIQSATGGVIRYIFTAADTVNAGTYNAQITLYYKAGNASGREVTVGNNPLNPLQVIITGEAQE